MDALLWDHSINEDAKEVPQGLKPEEEVNRFSVRRDGPILLINCALGQELLTQSS
jgi:hypothetical protein